MIDSFAKFIKQNFEGNLSLASRELRISMSSLSRILKGQRGIGLKTAKHIQEYCKIKKIDFRTVIDDDIFFN